MGRKRGRPFQLEAGANGVIIAFLRKHGGIAEINGMQFGRKHGYRQGSISHAIYRMVGCGILTIQSNDGPHLVVKLNEDVAMQYTNGSMPSSVPKVSVRAKPASSKNPILKQAESDLKYLREHAPAKAKDLQGVAASLIGAVLEARELLDSVMDNIQKLSHAAVELGATESEVQNALECGSQDVIKAQNDSSGELSSVPVVEFDEFFNEPPRIFQGIARLQANCRKLKSQLLELRRQSALLTVHERKLSELVREIQSVEVFDPTDAMNDWKKSADEALAGSLENGIAVVSTRE